jgi:starch synthase
MSVWESSGKCASVLFAAAEYDPLVKVGGLGEASAGLVGSLRNLGLDVEVVLPDYGNLAVRTIGPALPLAMPAWAGPALAQRVVSRFGGVPVTLISAPVLQRPHPYGDPDTGHGYADNDLRFMTFSAAVAALAALRKPDLVHLNDWHTATVPAFLDGRIPTVLTIHNAAHHGTCDAAWENALGERGHHYRMHDACNPLAGGIATADKVIAVSPTYATEIKSHLAGGLEPLLRDRGDAVVGIRNGIDLARWHPVTNPNLPEPFDADDLHGKEICRKHLIAKTNLDDDDTPIIALVSRFAQQKGIDIVLDLAEFLPTIGARVVMIGEGECELVARAARVAGAHPNRIHFFARYQEALANLVVAGADLLLVPSRFEPCGLTQMQAMTCGTLPIATAVGGLKDTVIDCDRDPIHGNGFIAETPSHLDVLDAIHRAVRAVNDRNRHSELRRRAMSHDWSWDQSARDYLDVYRSAIASH